ncbi:MAG: glucose-6-phosphate isomerase family protein [Candidatus Aenigmatarchaeota archaeon]
MEIPEMKIKGRDFLEVEFSEMPVFWERKMSELIKDKVILDLKNARKALGFYGDRTVYLVYNLWKGIVKYKLIKDKYKLNFDVTLLKGGVFSLEKNGETFLTYGHKHEKERGEFYFVLKNGCYLLLADLKKKKCFLVEMKEGESILIHPRFLHRLISKGKDCLVLGIVPEDAGHNYKIVKGRGFPFHIFMKDGWLEIVENKKYKGFEIEKVYATKNKFSLKKLQEILFFPNKAKAFYKI